MTELAPMASENSVSSGNTRKRQNGLIKARFTLNNYTEKDISKLLDTLAPDEYIFQEEIGEKCGTPHLQGVVFFHKKVRPTEYCNWTKRINWQVCSKPIEAKRYCCKDETRSGKIYHNIPLPPKENKLKILKELDLYIWQKKLLEIFKNEPNDRIINWYWEPKGGGGKTSFAKYLCYYYNFIMVSGKANDMKFGIVSYMKKNKTGPPGVIINIPKSNIDFVSYSGIEEIKDGIFFSGKYESEMVMFNSPHLIVFANEEPDYEKFTKSRWNVVKITNNL